jgi:acyl-CoA synthetase (AMP-forming)/AMP-acid ligase II
MGSIAEAMRQAPFHLGQLIEWPLAWHPDAEAIVWSGGVLSYSELAAKIEARTIFFRAQGLGRFDRCAIAFEASPEFFISLFALLRLGCVAAPISPRLPLDQYAQLFSSLGFRAALFPPSHRARGRQGTLPLVETIVEGGLATLVKTYGAGDSTGSVGTLVDVDPALILWSSGSTKSSRGAVLQHHAILANIQSNVRAVGYDDNDRTLVVLPVAHAYALVHQCLCTLAVGGALCLPDSPLAPPVLCGALSAFRVTTLTAVPSVLKLLLEGLKRGRYDLSPLRLVTVGGSPSDGEVLRECKRLLPHVRFLLTYGLTQACPRVSTHEYDPERHEAGCLGRPLANVELLVREGTDRTGELVLRGRMLLRSYADEPFPEGTDHTFRTSDLVERRRGELLFRGRMERVINRGGVTISVEAIENALRQHPRVLRARVEPEAHPFWGHVPVASVVPRAGEPFVTPQDLMEYCGQNLPLEERPARIVILDVQPGLPTKEEQMLAHFQPSDAGSPHSPPSLVDI